MLQEFTTLNLSQYMILFCDEGGDDIFQLTIFQDRKKYVDNLWQADPSLSH